MRKAACGQRRCNMEVHNLQSYKIPSEMATKTQEIREGRDASTHTTMHTSVESVSHSAHSSLSPLGRARLLTPTVVELQALPLCSAASIAMEQLCVLSFKRRYRLAPHRSRAKYSHTRALRNPIIKKLYYGILDFGLRNYGAPTWGSSSQRFHHPRPTDGHTTPWTRLAVRRARSSRLAANHPTPQPPTI